MKRRDWSKTELSEAAIEEMCGFAERFPWKPAFPAKTARRFLTALVSSRRLIFDFHDTRGRAALAVLLDRVSNPANDACFEVLGLRPDPDVSESLLAMFNLAKAECPQERSGVQISVAEGSPPEEAKILAAGFKVHYDLFDMKRQSLADVALFTPPQIHPAAIEDADLVFNLLVASFSRNPETSIPDKSNWKSGFTKAGHQNYFLWKEGGDVPAFLCVAPDEAENALEIHLIGVRPSDRGRGLGAMLLKFRLSEARRRGFQSSYLTVAVQNKSALGIYQRAGFRVVQSYRAYRTELSAGS